MANVFDSEQETVQADGSTTAIAKASSESGGKLSGSGKKSRKKAKHLQIEQPDQQQGKEQAGGLREVGKTLGLADAAEMEQGYDEGVVEGTRNFMQHVSNRRHQLMGMFTGYIDESHDELEDE